MQFPLLSLLTLTLAAPALGSTSFRDTFDRTGILEETGSMADSASPDWWLNSGGRLHLTGDGATTIVGSLLLSDPWRILYGLSSPIDTDGGDHPQNLFRLVTRSRWQSFRQELSFRILATNLSASPERNAWSGILLFHRYLDGDGRDEIVTGTASRGAPHVRFFRLEGGGFRSAGGFLAYARTLRTGVRVAACDLDGNGLAEVVTGPGPGSAADVRTYEADAEAVRAFTSFPVAGPEFDGGVEVGCGPAS